MLYYWATCGLSIKKCTSPWAGRCCLDSRSLAQHHRVVDDGRAGTELTPYPIHPSSEHATKGKIRVTTRVTGAQFQVHGRHVSPAQWGAQAYGGFTIVWPIASIGSAPQAGLQTSVGVDAGGSEG